MVDPGGVHRPFMQVQDFDSIPVGECFFLMEGSGPTSLG
jgi:hypothetical protein